MINSITSFAPSRSNTQGVKTCDRILLVLIVIYGGFCLGYLRGRAAMAIDVKANAAYHEAKNIKFEPGMTVWLLGIQFRVIGVKDGQLTLEPLNATI